MMDVLKPQQGGAAKVRISKVRVKPSHTVPGHSAERYVYENGGIHKAFFVRSSIDTWTRAMCFPPATWVQNHAA